MKLILTPEEAESLIVRKACELAELTYESDGDNHIYICANERELEEFVSAHKTLSNTEWIAKKYVESKWNEILDEIATLGTCYDGFHSVFLNLEDGSVSSGFFINEPCPELPDIEVFRITSDDCVHFEHVREYYSASFTTEEIAEDLLFIGAIDAEEAEKVLRNVAEGEEDPFFHLDRVQIAHAIWRESGTMPDNYDPPEKIICEYGGIELIDFIESLESHWDILA